MDEKGITVLRPFSEQVRGDFIVGALLALSEQFPDIPVALRYNTFRPWLGETPKPGTKPPEQVLNPLNYPL